ncbi:hypothetical protein MRX96_043054 [Rhipicephalus microplus]
MGRVLQRLDFRAYDKTRKPPKAMCERDVVHHMDALEKKTPKLSTYLPQPSLHYASCIRAKPGARMASCPLTKERKTQPTLCAGHNRVSCAIESTFLYIFFLLCCTVFYA